jgi:hypothetical protein
LNSLEHETNEAIRNKLENIIRDKDVKIEHLMQALYVPRHHFHHVERKLADEIIVQKEEIVKRLAADRGIPPEKLLDAVYTNNAKKEAQK